MKKFFPLLLIGASLYFFSCQKEASSGDDMAAVNESRNNTENSVPFRGSYTTRSEFLQGPAVQRITGTGQATHLGESVFVANATVNFSTPPPFAVSGTTVWTAANGDQFYSSFTGASTPTGNGTSRAVLNHTITGGTGRFEHATGNIIGISLVNQANPTNTVTYEGTINY